MAFHRVSVALQTGAAGRQAIPGVEQWIAPSASLIQTTHPSVHSAQSSRASPNCSTEITLGGNSPVAEGKIKKTRIRPIKHNVVDRTELTCWLRRIVQVCVITFYAQAKDSVREDHQTVATCWRSHIPKYDAGLMTTSQNAGDFSMIALCYHRF
ncbi:hypothetical protein [Beijerinckia indica]|uniref:hypothetical protein n=1 Tax=Beijerinckia indica TaxID=533 RepID=UPI0011D03FFB|nr:hypothetical protein [Beijerinckia indica]